MAERKSMVFYFDWFEMLDDMPDKKDAYEVLHGIKDFLENGEIREFKDPAANMAYRFMRGQAERDAAKYDKKIEQRIEAGRAGGLEAQKRNREKVNEANQANASSAGANRAYASSASSGEANQANDTEENEANAPSGEANQANASSAKANQPVYA